jgi:hypothetical protein
VSARLLRRALSLALLLSLVSDGLPFDAVVPSVPDVDAAPVGPSAPSDPLAEVTPLGVAGTPNGEDLSASKVDGRVLLEPPVDAVPSDESLDERLARERASEPQPVSVGFDPLRSVEDVSERSRFGTVYDNPDGTKTVTMDVEAQHYQRADGRWVDIDPRLVPVRDQPGVFRTAASSMIVEVSSAGLQVTGEKGQTITMAPGDGSARLPDPTISEDGLTATYPEVWPGVDVRFVVTNSSVRKELVLTRRGTGAAFDLNVAGVVLSQDETGRITTSKESEFTVGQVAVYDRDGLPIDGGAKPTQQLTKTDGDTSVIRVGVDPVWLEKVPVKEFPIVIDPSWSSWSFAGSSIGIANGGSVACSTNWSCSPVHVGNNYTGAFGDMVWRHIIAWDYSSILPTSTVASQLTNATINLQYTAGSTSNRWIVLRHATGFDWCGFNAGDNCGNSYSNQLASGLMTNGSLAFDVTSYINSGGFWAAGQPPIAWALSSEENTGVNTFKQLGGNLALTFDRLPIVSQSVMSPANGHTFHESGAGVTLSVPQLTDPDGEALYYRFVLCDTGCMNIYDDSGWDSIGVPDSTPWDYMSSLYPVGPGLTAGFYNKQLYWKVLVSNSAGGGFFIESPYNSWMLVNTCPATPQFNAPAASFVWAPNSSPTFTITPYADGDGDWVRYRLLVREKGSAGALWRSEWTSLSNSTSAINFNLPASAPLQAGVEYEWSAEAQDQTTYFHYYFYEGAPCSAASSFRAAGFDDRLGAGGPSPMQNLGPVTVNLATGNLTTAVSTPQVSTLGGAMGVSMSYNSRANDIGLRGRLFNDANNNGVADSGELVTSRVDRAMTMQWSTPAAAPGVSNFVGTWTGYITVADRWHVSHRRCDRR